MSHRSGKSRSAESEDTADGVGPSIVIHCREFSLAVRVERRGGILQDHRGPTSARSAGTKKKEATRAKQVRSIPLVARSLARRGCDALARTRQPPSADSSPRLPLHPTNRETRASAGRSESPTRSRRPLSALVPLLLPYAASCPSPRRWSWAKSWLVPAMAGGLTAEQCRAQPNRRTRRAGETNEQLRTSERSERVGPRADKDYSRECYHSERAADTPHYSAQDSPPNQR